MLRRLREILWGGRRPASTPRTPFAPPFPPAENKFFKADGVKFMPFSFVALAQAANDEA